ncbi:piggyBac transposable element-derived protein 4-like [Pecten maximus]|uniref:piggyBac transposable element-derived protein 4-like n=2 Tax=Pecten maximus TaxID=6579 RepID=UPI0014591277|nr:piggyBac transposable element-derived protein 4-like [Pecten maximus]XP_033741129.1 piggyBac transposable element-derived protein 4-like [Pecten maximus]
MAGQQYAGELAQVLPEYHQIYQEIFLDEDSDEFEGFDINDIDDISEEETGFHDNNWVEGSKEPSTFTFTGNAGINTEVLPVPEEGSLSYLDYFECIFTDNILEMIVEETNRYAATYIQTHTDLPSHSRYRKWTDTTVGEMKAFIGMTIAMGLVQQMDIQDYWSNDVVINTPFFRSVMSRDRFLSLLSVLHLADNTASVPRGQPGYSPLQKLGDPYKEILSNFQRCYNPSKNIAIDEGMIPWRGKLHFRVYSPDKPIKYGLKVYMLCDSDNGYCSRMELYTGHGGQNMAPSQFGATYDLIMRLADPFLNKGYHLYMDNYFSSPHLFYSLYLNGTLACGTLRKNRRGVPQALKNRNLIRGEMFTMNNDMLVAVKYADKKDVHLLTTIHKGVMVDSGKRDQEGIEIRKPDCILSYNKYMGAVDRCDQMVAYGSFERRTLKWWKKVFFHVIGLAVLNSYIIYKTRCQQPVLQRVFRRELVNQLVTASEISGASPRGRKRTSAEVLQRLTARHFICHLPSSGKRDHAKRRCVVCGPAEAELFRSSHPDEPVPKRTGRETSFQCKQCQVALCIEPCFELFHTKSEYVLAYKRQKSALEE